MSISSARSKTLQPEIVSLIFNEFFDFILEIADLRTSAFRREISRLSGTDPY